MAGYVKLFGSILQSTVWETPATTRCVWITMLAMSDMDGVVSASIPGLARMAGVTRAEAEDALAAFLSPDPDSRTKDHNGRRIEEIDGGWRLLNHAKYRAMQTRDERREKDAERKRRARAVEDADRCGQMRTDADSPQSHAPSRPVTGSEADQDQKQDQDLDAAPAPARSTTSAKTWTVHDWREQYGRAWAEKYQRFYGDAGDTVACVKLGDVIGSWPESERADVQRRASQMFAEFLAKFEPRVVERRHPFLFFVQEFGGLRVPKKSGPVDIRCDFHRRGFRGKIPREGAHDSCPECRHSQALTGGRTGDVASVADVLATERKVADLRAAAAKEWTPEQRAEMHEALQRDRQPAKAAVS